MKIICWHQPVAELKAREYDWQLLLVQWEKSWKKFGFDPCIVGLPVARPHALFHPVYSKAKSMPTCNARDYEVGCWLRWLAAAEVARRTRKSVLVADSDVINFGITPAMCDAFKEDITFLDSDRVCCLVHLTPRGAEQVVEGIMGYQVPEGRSHTSDMFFFWETMSKKLPTPHGVQVGPFLCEDYSYVRKDPTLKPLAIHFSSKSCPSGRTPKSSAVHAYATSRAD
jgi:hypothetical protein